jgi:hypothetical protein
MEGETKVKLLNVQWVTWVGIVLGAYALFAWS